ncbi:immunoglobulin-like domain-containing protein, partial [Paraeggerthella sp. LCP19S3_G8]|uniref:immunoglobulin-like domain-containing protein n=1 Tax=Paraeggerthella sp. LCP19S3_G8 TaxID=3440248 RepID=UPI003F960BF7
RPAETEVRTDDGVWAFKGYDADSKVAAGAVGFTGTWVFNPNASVLNRVPAISASDRVIAVGDAFDPLEGVSASDEEDGDLTDKVEVLSSTVDASKPGVYEVVYKAADGDGASAVKTIKVTVQARMQELPGNSDGDSNAGSQTPGNKLVKTGDAWALGASALVGAVVLAGAVLLSARRLMKNESGRIK